MAIKGIILIDYYQLYNDQTYNVGFSLCDNGHLVTGLFTDSYFGGDASADTVNSAIKDIAITYLHDVWEVEYTPITDSLTIINPLQTLGL